VSNTQNQHPTSESADPRISVGLEQGADGWIRAHALGMAGCAAAGPSPEDAVAAFEADLVEWLTFLSSVNEPVPPREAELEIAVDEWIETDANVAMGESTALFAADVRAVSGDELLRGVRLLGDLRGRLLARVRAIPRREVEAALDAAAEGGWTVRQVMEELARAQWWTLSRLGATPMAGSPDATLARLDTAMALVVQHLGHLEPERRGARLEIDGEEWTPRKVLRRLLWLEWTLGRAAARGLDAAVAA
jgi:predicted RNase H-like HicB family nuclease